MGTINNAISHFKKICTHKRWVFHYCRYAGIPWQGITHDLSKFSPTEFIESVKFYQGIQSPINAAKKQQGYSMAWLHHKGRNKHHYHYWMDNFDKGGENILMPEKYFIEFVCDSLGANRAYNGKKFSYFGEYQWWQQERENPMMNPKLKGMLDIIFWDLYSMENFILKDAALTEGKTEEEKNTLVEESVQELLRSGYLSKVYRANV